MKPKHRIPKLPFDLRIALLYTLFGGLWILLSDRLLETLVSDISRLSAIQTYKGWIFVAVSALYIFFLIRSELLQRGKAERKILQLKRLYATLSQVNQTIMRVKNREDLFQTFCDVAVQYGEFDLAWIGLLDDASGDVRPVTASGSDIKQFTLPYINIHDEQYQNALITQALQTLTVVISENILTDVRTVPLRSHFQHYPYRAAAVLPFKTESNPAGVLVLLSEEHGVLKNEDEINLLNELRLDIAFALETLENEAERQHMQHALQHNEEKYRTFFETSLDAILLTSPDGSVHAANPAACHMFGRTQEEICAVGRDGLVDRTDPRLQALLEKRAQTGRASGEITMLRADGSPFPVEIASALFQDSEGNDRTSMIIRDITERKRTEEELRSLNDQLEQRVIKRTSELQHANRAKDEFLANMSHELRTPLNTVLGLSETLLEQRSGTLNEKQFKSVELISSSGRHLLGLINDILEVSKIEAGKLELHITRVSVREVGESSLHFVRQLATKKMISLHFYSDESAATIDADPQRLKQILINLLMNAVKFTPEHGQVSLEIRTNHEQNLALFSVADTGIGITQDDLKKLFTPFTQLDSSLSRQYAGTGLGLTLVQKLTDLHGGSVQVESAPGSGSRFSVSLPLQHGFPESVLDAQVSASEDHPEDSPVAPEKHSVVGNILLAEDNEINRKMLTDYLVSHGYQVSTAQDGLEALEKAAQTAPDVVLMDIQMPHMDGLQAMRHLRADPRFVSTPIVALTALAMPGDKERCMEAGASEYLSKPVSLKTLIQLIEKLLLAKA